MKSTSHKIDVKRVFVKIRTIEDLTDLICMLYPQEYLRNPNTMTVKAFRYFTSPSIPKTSYKSFQIAKKSGGKREINAPVSMLKAFQTGLNVLLQEVFEAHKAATGFVPGSSIVDNARPHLNQNYVFNIDLKDFFTSIDQARIWKRLQHPPFNLSKENGRLELANRIAALCCTEMEVDRKNGDGEWIKVKRNVLPQGAPTSPVISNIIAYRLDFLLTGLANRFGLNYTRYADDITFSSKHNVYQNDGDFLKELHRIIEDQNFCINPSKTRLQKRGFRQETTGLIVNEKINVRRSYIKELRKWLYLWERYGYGKASDFFKVTYNNKHKNVLPPSLLNVLDGKLEYLKMVKGKDDNTYKKLFERFVKLNAPQSKLSEILDVWEARGIEKAMEVFNYNKD